MIAILTEPGLVLVTFVTCVPWTRGMSRQLAKECINKFLSVRSRSIRHNNEVARVTGRGHVTGQSFLLFYPRGWDPGRGTLSCSLSPGHFRGSKPSKSWDILSVGQWDTAGLSSCSQTVSSSRPTLWCCVFSSRVRKPTLSPTILILTFRHACNCY